MSISRVPSSAAPRPVRSPRSLPRFSPCANLNSKLQVAVVGANGQGFSDLSEIGSHASAQFVGFCDVDTARFNQVEKKFPDIAHFQDFREMFAKLGDRSTPCRSRRPITCTPSLRSTRCGAANTSIARSR
jgi:hypothetical protein